MLNAIKQSGAAWNAIKLAEQFEQSMTDEQRVIATQLKTLVGGIASEFAPDEMKPVLSYVLAEDNNDPLIAKVIGAWLHPGTKQALKGLLPQPDQSRVIPDEGIAIQCRHCSEVGMYAAKDHG